MFPFAMVAFPDRTVVSLLRASPCGRRLPGPRTDRRGRSDFCDVAGVGRERRAAALRMVADLGALGRRGVGLEGVLTGPEQLGDEVRSAALRVTELEVDQPGEFLDEGNVLIGVAAVEGPLVGRLVVDDGQSVHGQLPPGGCRISRGRWDGVLDTHAGSCQPSAIDLYCEG